ncbi:MAG: pre-peptidase C-terminal domain-containing protein [Anaerolineae bacterium]|nr:pre-peptidase C-terminal domain-containing protein [Anaerolineae bacterium]
MVLASPGLQGGRTPIQYNTTTPGTITAVDYFLVYTFAGRAGDVVQIEMTATSGDLDPFVGLFDPDETLLISNDDIDWQGGNANSRIDPYTLPVDGTYIIAATRYQVEEGTTTGTFSLVLTLISTGGQVPPTQAASPTPFVPTATPQAAPTEPGVPTPPPPELDVTYKIVGYGETLAGMIPESGIEYFAFYGAAGDIAVANMLPASSEIIPTLRIFDIDLEPLSDTVDSGDGRVSTYFVVPTEGWYLIGAGSQGGTGSYTLETIGLPATWLSYGSEISGEVQRNDPSNWYVFEAQRGDTIHVTMTATGGDLVPYFILADINLTDLAWATVGDNPATLTYSIPRDGPYSLLVSREDLRDGTTSGSFTLTLEGASFNPTSVRADPLGYGRTVEGIITDAEPVLYYSFQGKAEDLITVTMEAGSGVTLDPYLILADAEFNELTFSDNEGATNNARIFQYQLPVDGLYYILATRPGQEYGQGMGGFTLELIEGEIELTAGAVEATLRWNNTADVDIFVRDPNGDFISWDNPTVPSGGTLEVDTNSNCETLTSLPVEHVFWPQGTTLPGVYEFYVWYQLDCENLGPVTFDLSVLVNGVEIAHASDELARGQRYETSITVDIDGTAVSNNDGEIVTPDSNSSNADIPIAYGQTLTGTINDDHYFQWYEFPGNAGDHIEVSAERTSGDLDTLIALLDDNEELLLNDDDGGDGLNSRLTYTLPYTGRYLIGVTRYGVEDGASSGEYQVTLRLLN